MKNESGVRWKAVCNVAAALMVLAATAGCQLTQNLFPRTHTTSLSPDGRYTAFVRQAASLDPPNDHLYLGPSGGTARRLMGLAPDSDWCRTIVWTSDSRKVGFLIRDQRLAIFDTATDEQLAFLQLVLADGYPGSQGARKVVLRPDGVVSFERFERATDRALGTETATIPGPRLSLRMSWAETNAPVNDAWVSVTVAYGNSVGVRTTPGADGLVRLPAIAAGPFGAVHISIPGVGVAVLSNVPVTERPLKVKLTRQSGRLVAESS
jgi:hypothetical protein